MMARREAELVLDGVPPRLINQRLRGHFPQRTVEAIKGRRKRQDYKNMVTEFVETGSMGEEAVPPPENIVEDPLGDRILQFLESIERMNTQDFGADRLQEITRKARTSGKESTLQRVALYLREIFPPPAARTTRVANKTSCHITNKKRARRMEYATTQGRWRRDRRRCIGEILEGLGSNAQPPRDVMEPYWTAVMGTNSVNEPRVAQIDSVDDIWRPVTELDLRAGRVPRASAAGPDGVSARLFSSIPSGVLIRIYNLLMWCEGLPEDLLRSRTVFVPKIKEAREPGEFRPITIPSVITRGLHKILAKRMEAMLEIDPRQRAFRSTDGCADNIFLLDMILRYHRKKFRSMYMAALDVSKAFDSISHPAIGAVLRGVGVPAPAIRYLTSVYRGSRTYLQGNGWRSSLLHPQRGVRQGDPLSPVLFNAMTHLMLKALPEEIGVEFGGTSINAAAFADDLLLFASTPDGLQRLINETSGFLGACGMSINPLKSFTASIKAAPHMKKTVVAATQIFKCGERNLPAVGRTSQWKYLGVTFTPEGRTLCRPAAILGPLLEVITKAPLKPQQRMFALRTIVVPKLYHQLALGAVTVGILNRTDRMLRTAVRRWLALPHDVPTGYFHATIRDGGLGVPSLRWTAPLHRRGRLLAAQKTHFHRELGGYIEEELARCERKLTDHGTLYNTPELVNKHWSNRLYTSVDGGGLRNSGKTPHQHQWIADGTRLLSGRDYINCGRLRISALPTRSRMARGRNRERHCRAGCHAQETINHILQQCHRTHAQRIRRHDAILDYMERRIRRSGYEIHKEPRYRTSLGLRKPDLVAVLGQTAIVVDAQVVSEQTELEVAHRRKTTYYAEEEIVKVIKETHNVRTIKTTSATLSWKGIWSSQSAQELLKLGFISTADLKIISTRVLVGGVASFRIFNSTTSLGWTKTGIG